MLDSSNILLKGSRGVVTADGVDHTTGTFLAVDFNVDADANGRLNAALPLRPPSIALTALSGTT
jgi:hypothetical protein